MNILYYSDLHGTKWKFDLIAKLIKKHKIDIVINGGDILPKDGNRTKQELFLNGYLKEHLEQINLMGVYYLLILGNDDMSVLDDQFQIICNQFPKVFNIAQKKVKIAGYEFIGMNLVSDYPFRLKDRCRKDFNNFVLPIQYGSALLSTMNGYSEINNWESHINTLPTIEDELKKLPISKFSQKTIYVIHMPPSKLGLDLCLNGQKVGSISIYNFLKKIQPKLSLHGHIHESPKVSYVWCSDVGKTTVIQPGQLSDFTYVVCDLQKSQNRIFHTSK